LIIKISSAVAPLFLPRIVGCILNVVLGKINKIVYTLAGKEPANPSIEGLEPFIIVHTVYASRGTGDRWPL